ncbi:hypothetical protein P170DRAFT_434953 [Aspergillus steynii IBT 23096]|uniref:Uncharacterized protein n=1 Tax=Aspergillus steynii IBT 23096 TaxID=1392250 RepID=A0A2I2GK32_9EURO|nr:uncharacterized protein P170DRAFT_434953 [Aspergillus steynii IBT 23096]PLB53246.1 hypothetical protein P170DRAFT_434953 [Aspergillus steynii IBT 23096]
MAPSHSPSPARVGSRTVPINSRPSLETNFTDPSFDPADFLNDALPPLTLASSQAHGPRNPGAVSLAESSTQVQSILTQINAQNVRLSNNLTQLTDEILRSGGRLAYEVEVLRGETIGLSDTLTDALRDDIAKFVPESTEKKDSGAQDPSITPDEDQTPKEADEATEPEPEQQLEPEDLPAVADPEYITKLRTLNQVRARLEEVVQTFGDAMEWTLPPSETSLTSSFISVSAPEPGSESHSREEKGQEIMKKLRAEITELLDSNGGGEEGVDAATQRVDALRDLATVWKGTAEEKARARFVDGLAKMIEDRRRMLENQGKMDPAQSQAKAKASTHRRQESEGPGGGIFRNLQRLREEIYLE